MLFTACYQTAAVRYRTTPSRLNFSGIDKAALIPAKIQGIVIALGTCWLYATDNLLPANLIEQYKNKSYSESVLQNIARRISAAGSGIDKKLKQ